MRTFLKALGTALAALLVASFIAVVVATPGAFSPHTPPILGPDGEPLPGSVAELRVMELGGVEQYVLIRGADASNPVLLWLHGGPGAAQMPLAHWLDRELEEEFVVVHWDQRGAGKSNPRGFDETSMTLDRFLDDTRELMDHLRARLGHDRIFLLGHSWGALLGIQVAARYPEDLHAYIGVSQVVDNHRGYNLAYEWLRAQIDEEPSARGSQLLEELGHPPYVEHADHVAFARLVGEYGGNFDVDMGQLIRIGMAAPEYGLLDYLRWLRGANRGSGPMWDPVFARPIDLMAELPSLEIPVFLLSGREDYNTPMELVAEYHRSLEAPYKELVVFEGAAHTPFLADPQRFREELIRIKGAVGSIQAPPN
jgi:pimeloyl-ACP methyl ester carboxylesterase